LPTTGTLLTTATSNTVTTVGTITTGVWYWCYSNSNKWPVTNW
jgi:hypothetical protein